MRTGTPPTSRSTTGGHAAPGGRRWSRDDCAGDPPRTVLRGDLLIDSQRRGREPSPTSRTRGPDRMVVQRVLCPLCGLHGTGWPCSRFCWCSAASYRQRGRGLRSLPDILSCSRIRRWYRDACITEWHQGSTSSSPVATGTCI